MKFEKLEALRGFAAIYVVIYHLLMPVKLQVAGFDLLFFFRFGQEAVILFFLLSGFVIEYSFERSKDKSFKSYFLKRSTRIYIPLFFVLILSYALQSIAVGELINPAAGSLIANILMLQDVKIKPNVFFSTYMDNKPLWSLAFEWWFYMLYYLLYKLCSPKNLNKVVAIGVLLAGVSLIIYPFFLNRNLFYFGIWWVGVEFAKLYLKKKDYTFSNARFSFFILGSCLFITGLNLLIHSPVHQHISIGVSPFLEFRHFLFSILVSAGAITWYKLKWRGFDKLFGMFTIFSPITYAVYICHWPLLINRDYLHSINSGTGQILVALVLTFVFAYLLELKIYPPIKDWMFKVAYKRHKAASLKKVEVAVTI
jgi:peptidoglycan/LPS O-acetylase OafA/YrhL